MATEEQVIDSTRRTVADFESPRKYDDDYYKDAIERGLQKLNFDFGESYAIVPDVPFDRVFLLIKLASINMCWFRASEGATGDSEIEHVETKYTTIAVPNLSVTDGNTGDSRGPTYWMKLADKIQEEYDNEVGSSAGQNQGSEVEIGTVRRISLTNGGYRKRVLDPGLDAVTITTLVSGNDVTISWSKLQVEDFFSYEVVRSEDGTFDDEIVIRTETDIHVTEYTDESVVSGTWYYRVKSVNRNFLKTDSSTSIAVVP